MHIVKTKGNVKFQNKKNIYAITRRQNQKENPMNPVGKDSPKRIVKL